LSTEKNTENIFWDSLEVLEHQHWVASSFKGRGDLEFSGNLRFSGTWKGVIRAFVHDSHLFVRGGAQIQGRIQAPQVTIEGSLQDIEIFAERVRILAGAHIQGRVTAKVIIVEEGAVVEGRIRVEKNLEFSASDKPQIDKSF